MDASKLGFIEPSPSNLTLLQGVRGLPVGRLFGMHDRISLSEKEFRVGLPIAFHSRPLMSSATLARAAGTIGLAAIVGSTLTGCSSDSFFDPSVSGRWDPTPTTMPVLSRIAAIEDETGDLVEFSDPVSGDLVPAPSSYRIGAGDVLEVTVWDLIEQSRPERYEVTVDQRGLIELPQLGRLAVAGRTADQAVKVIQDAMRRFLENPLAQVNPLQARQQTFTIQGSIERPGPYYIPRADYRILEALTSGGRFDESIEEVYVIRQVPLSEALVTKRPEQPAPPERPRPTKPVTTKPESNAPKTDPNELLRAIDDLAGPDQGGKKPVIQPGISDGSEPGMVSSDGEPANQPAPVIDLPFNGQPSTVPAVKPDASTTGAESDTVPPPAPVIDLDGTSNNTNSGNSSWLFIDGKWLQVSGTAPRATPEQARANAEKLMTQRVIRIPLSDLLSGKPALNIVIRPGDVIRVPQTNTGVVYIGGQVNGPGVYSIPPQGGLTLMRALTSARGLAPTGIPERIDLTRTVGRGREATIMLDGKAIANRTQPDILLKANDHVNVGSNFWAVPLAVFRNGLRMNYGFGTVLDRNLANDLFGPPPVNQFGE